MVIISGPSGVGKDTIIEAMQRRRPPHPRHYVITVTTRARRPTEVAGVSYHFLSLDDYARLRDHDGLLEASEVHGNWYGTPRDQVQSALAAGRDAILKIDVQGAHKVRQKVRDALLIFVVPPSLEALQERLVGRSTNRRPTWSGAGPMPSTSCRARPTTTTWSSTRRTRSTARPSRSTPSSRPSTPASPTAASSSSQP